MLRRTLLKALTSGLILIFPGRRFHAQGDSHEVAFLHGVASGDPLADRVILWTRLSGLCDAYVSVKWQIATDAEMQNVIRDGMVHTGPERDFTVKVDADRLPAGTRLHYRFQVGDVASDVGSTRTLPLGEIDAARFAVVSCSNYAAGYFHAYREIARRQDIDAVIHLGDYIYEHGMGEYATQHSESMGRVPDPLTEILTLTDYRRRHAQYKSDPDSQAMLAAHPLIAVWDDHDVANDAWRGGAENHNDREDVEEGSWEQRQRAAFQAYFEWMPIRGEFNGHRAEAFRNFDFGNLVSLIMLDTRFYGRDKHADVSETDRTRQGVESVLATSKQHMLGRRQERWLRDRMRGSGATWQVIGQQVLVSRFYAPNLEPLLDLEKPAIYPVETLKYFIEQSKTSPPALLDGWDGYPWARRRLLRDVSRFARNPVFLSGDLHTAMAGNLCLSTTSDAVAVEFMPSSVTSPGFADYLPERRPGVMSAATLQQNPQLRYMQTGSRGWLCMTFTEAECTGEWHMLDSVTSPDYRATVDKRMSVAAGRIAAGLHDT